MKGEKNTRSTIRDAVAVDEGTRQKKRTHNNWTLQPPQRTASFFSQSVLFDVCLCDLNNSEKGQHTQNLLPTPPPPPPPTSTNAKCVQQSASIGTCAVVDNIKLHLIHVDITFSKWQTATTKTENISRNEEYIESKQNDRLNSRGRNGTKKRSCLHC